MTVKFKEETIINCEESNCFLECTIYNVFTVGEWTKCKDVEKCPIGIDRTKDIDPDKLYKSYERRMLEKIKEQGNAGTLALNDWEVNFIRDMLKKNIFSVKQTEVIKKIHGRCKDDKEREVP